MCEDLCWAFTISHGHVTTRRSHSQQTGLHSFLLCESRLCIPIKATRTTFAPNSIATVRTDQQESIVSIPYELSMLACNQTCRRKSQFFNMRGYDSTFACGKPFRERPKRGGPWSRTTLHCELFQCVLCRRCTTRTSLNAWEMRGS